VTQPVTQPPVTPPVVQPATPTSNVFAGQPGVAGASDGPAAQARFRLPNNVAVDNAGNVYVADTANDIIRKITPDGTVSTLAGSPGSGGSADGTGSQARFWAPFGIAVDDLGDVYVADTANNAIRKITPAGVVGTLAGQAGQAGSDDGAGPKARFRNPWGLAVDVLGNLVVADMSNDTLRKITPAGTVTTLAGLAGISGHADGFGKDVRFNHPYAVAVDRADNIYVSDRASDTIRKVTAAGGVTTLAGLSGYTGYTDAVGSEARFRNPQGLSVDLGGNIYVADTGNNLIRKITPTGIVSTVPGFAADDPSSQAGGAVRLNNPGGVAVDAAGNLYVADTNNHCVRKIRIAN